MSTKRIAFEAWALKRFNAAKVPRICSPGSPMAGEYADSHWQLAREAWLAALAEAAQAPKWISVEDRLPEAGQLVLVSSDGWDRPKVLKFLVGAWGKDTWNRFSDNDSGRWYWYPERMHWQPIPAAPQPEGQQCQARATGATE